MSANDFVDWNRILWNSLTASKLCDITYSEYHRLDICEKKKFHDSLIENIFKIRESLWDNGK